jgi:dihydropyrimidinase
MASDYTPFDGLQVTGWPELVLVRGQVAVEGGQLAGSPPQGQAVRGGPVDVRSGRLL